MSNEKEEQVPDNENSSILGSSSSNSSIAPEGGNEQGSPKGADVNEQRQSTDPQAINKTSSSRQKRRSSEQRTSTRQRDTKDGARTGNAEKIQEGSRSPDSRSENARRERSRSLSSEGKRHQERRKRAQSDDSRPSSRRNRRGRSRSRSSRRSYSRSRSYSHRSRSRTHSAGADYRENQEDDAYRSNRYEQHDRKNHNGSERNHHKRYETQRSRGGRGGERPSYQGFGRDQQGGGPHGRWSKDLTLKENGLYMPSLSLPLVSYQQFAQLQTRHIRDLAGEYDQYKQDHEQKHFKVFIREHEGEQWFKEKYYPLIKYQLHLQQQEIALKIYGTIDQANYVDVNKWTIWIKNVPVWISRAQLREATNCTQIYCSEPLRMSKFQRICWLRFDSEEQYEAVLNSTTNKRTSRRNRYSDQSEEEDQQNQIPGFEIFGTNENGGEDRGERRERDRFVAVPQKSAVQQPESKKTPLLPADTLTRDLGFAKQLAGIYDQEIGSEISKVFEDSDESTQLQFVVKYLRIVHGYCFYTGVRCEDERQLAIKTCLFYERLMADQTDEVPRTAESLAFEQNYLLKAEEIIQKGPQPILNPVETDEQLKEQVEDFCARNCVQIIEGEKYRCEVANCAKTFRGEDFVRKHIMNKHENLITEFQENLFKDRAREAYINDPNRIQNPPLAHSSSFQNQTGMNKFRRRDFGDKNNNMGNRNMNRGENGKNFYNNGGQKSEDPLNQANGNGANADPSKPQQPPREYIDYDDPMSGGQVPVPQTTNGAQPNNAMGGQLYHHQQTQQPSQQQFGGQGQGQPAQNTNMSGQQQPSNQYTMQGNGAQQPVGFSAAVNKQSKQQIVSYDDLF